MKPTVNIKELRSKVRNMYQQVAEDPKGEFHFEMGRALAKRLGYPSEDLERIPAEAIESFAGVGYYFDLAALREGERVLDLGSGSAASITTLPTRARLVSSGAMISSPLGIELVHMMTKVWRPGASTLLK